MNGDIRRILIAMSRVMPLRISHCVKHCVNRRVVSVEMDKMAVKTHAHTHSYAKLQNAIVCQNWTRCDAIDIRKHYEMFELMR